MAGPHQKKRLRALCPRQFPPRQFRQQQFPPRERGQGALLGLLLHPWALWLALSSQNVRRAGRQLELKTSVIIDDDDAEAYLFYVHKEKSVT
jgi:hypothetical protein